MSRTGERAFPFSSSDLLKHMGKEEVETTGRSKAFQLCCGLKKRVSTREVRTFPKGRERMGPVRGLREQSALPANHEDEEPEALNTPTQVWGPPSAICHQTLNPVILDHLRPQTAKVNEESKS